MKKTAPFVVVAGALALYAPLSMADEKKPADKPAAAAADARKSHSATSTSDRQAAKMLVATGTSTAALGAARPAVRDWAAIDTNQDNLISPDEMKKHLEEQWAAQKK